MISTSIASLTCRMARTSLLSASTLRLQPIQAPASVAVRSFAKNSKKSSVDSSESLQHAEWVKFQQSIAVDGFETGQTTSIQKAQNKRGGKLLRRRQEKLLKAKDEKKRTVENLGGGRFPALRYSDDETDKLLAEAYQNIPKRAGKRGTRNLRRQSNRWFLVRKIHAKQKRHRIAAHERRMQKRGDRVRAVMEVKEESSAVRERDQAYQQYALQKWAEAMISSKEEIQT